MKGTKIIMCFSLILATVALAILVGFGTWAFFYSPGEVLQGEQEIDISDWLTYRNEEYGFEFKYPKGWDEICTSSVYCKFCAKQFNNEQYCIVLSLILEGRWRSEGALPTEQYIEQAVQKTCSALGIRGEVYCDEIMSNEFVINNNISVYKIILKETNENYVDKTKDIKIKSPIYIFELSKITSGNRAIYLQLEKHSNGSSEHLGLDEQKYLQITLDEVARTISYLE